MWNSLKSERIFRSPFPRACAGLSVLAEGDLVEAEVKDGALVIRPVQVVPAGQEYFHTREWQVKEAEADADIAAGRLIEPGSSLTEEKELFDQGKKPGIEPDGFYRSAGSWQGLIDPDELIAETK